MSHCCTNIMGLVTESRPMPTSEKNANVTAFLPAEVTVPKRIVLSAEQLFALSAQLARRLSNDPETLKALAEAFGRTHAEPPYQHKSKSRRAASGRRPVDGDLAK
jgi:hypothetical protein